MCDVLRQVLRHFFRGLDIGIRTALERERVGARVPTQVLTPVLIVCMRMEAEGALAAALHAIKVLVGATASGAPAGHHMPWT